MITMRTTCCCTSLFKFGMDTIIEYIPLFQTINLQLLHIKIIVVLAVIVVAIHRFEIVFLVIAVSRNFEGNLCREAFPLIDDCYQEG